MSGICYVLHFVALHQLVEWNQILAMLTSLTDWHKPRYSYNQTLLSVFLLTVKPFAPSISLYLSRRKKERDAKKAGGEALEDLEAKLKDRAETLGLSLEQKTKAMKQRDKMVTYNQQCDNNSVYH